MTIFSLITPASSFSPEIQRWLHLHLPRHAVQHESSVPHQPLAAGSDRRPVRQHLPTGPQIRLHRMPPAHRCWQWIRSPGLDSVKSSAPVLVDLSITYLYMLANSYTGYFPFFTIKKRHCSDPWIGCIHKRTGRSQCVAKDLLIIYR